jgi:hypothetical protein
MEREFLWAVASPFRGGLDNNVCNCNVYDDILTMYMCVETLESPTEVVSTGQLQLIDWWSIMSLVINVKQLAS